MLWWALLWFVLLIGAGLVLGLLGRVLWRKAKALTAEISEATERLTALLDSLNDMTDAAGHRPAPALAPQGTARPDGLDRRASQRSAALGRTIKTPDLDGMESL